MITKHYYTRERRGVYTNYPGYSTVAKSEKLSDAFVKKVLENYCFYEIPFELVNETAEDKFPLAYTCFNTEEGCMVLGSSSYITKDYEEKRSTYFTHNYIIPKDEKEAFIRNPIKIIYASPFTYSFNIESSNVLPEIEATELETSEFKFSSFECALKELKISEKVFKQLVMACFMSVSKNKKIYIILDVDISFISVYAKELLKYIYDVLPYEIRRKLGYATYVKDIKSKEYINIEFLPKSAVKSISTEVSSSYLFDFYRNRFLTEDLKAENHGYIDFAVENVENKNKLKKYMEAMDEMITDNRLVIDEYDKFCEMFSAAGENINMYDKILKERNIMEQEAFFNSIDLESISIKNIKKLKLLPYLKNSEKYEVLSILQQIVSINNFIEADNAVENISSSQYKNKIKSIIKNLYKTKIIEENYLKIMFGFIKEKDEFDFDEAFRYFYDNGDIQEVRKFILWIFSNSEKKLFLKSVEVLKAAIKTYFDEYDSKVFKDKEMRKLLLNASKGEMKEFILKEEYIRSGIIRRMFLKGR